MEGQDQSLNGKDGGRGSWIGREERKKTKEGSRGALLDHRTMHTLSLSCQSTHTYHLNTQWKSCHVVSV